MLLKGKSAIVTGGAGRIGKAICLLLASEGASVVVSDSGVNPDGVSPDKGPAKTVAREIQGMGGRALASSHSIAETEGAKATIKACLDAFGSVDILVNCAGILINGLILDTPEDVWDRQMAVHSRGTFLCSKYAGLRMRDQKWGRIINFTSRGGLTGYPGINSYAMAKGGVTTFTWMLALELAFYNITVNAVAPTVVAPRRPSKTGRGEPAMPGSVMKVRQAYDIDTPYRDPSLNLRPEPVAALVAYLASDEASYVNGQVIAASGNRMDLWSRPERVKTAFHQRDWDVEAIRKNFRSTIGAGMSNPIPKLPG